MANYKVDTDAQNTGLDCEVFATQDEAEQAVKACKDVGLDQYRFDVLPTNEPVSTTFSDWDAKGW